MILGAVLDAEGDLLGSNAAALVDASGLAPTDFDEPRARAAWQLIQLAVAKRKPVSADVLWSAGASSRHFQPADKTWLRELQSRNNLSREAFAEIVSDFRRLTRGRVLEQTLMRHAQALRERSSSPEVVAAALEGQLRELTALQADDGTGEADILEIAQEWDRQETDGSSPLVVPTGIELLDGMIGGGWRPNLNVVAGLPAVGKSAGIGTCMDAEISLGIKVGLFGLEDGTRWFAKRLIARDLKIPLAEVGIKHRDPALQNAFSDAANLHAHRLKNLITYRHDTISVDELVRRATHWIVNLGVQVIYVDHGGEVDHHTERFDEHRLRVAETYRRLRNLAVRHQVPVVVLVHTTRDSDDDTDRPPRTKEIAESAYIERRARLILGLWRRFHERGIMRATVLKNTEGEANLTAKLERLVECALLDPLAGERVNLEQERREEFKKARETKAAEKAKDKELQAKAAADLKAAKEAAAKKAKPQLELVGEPGGEDAK